MGVLLFVVVLHDCGRTVVVVVVVRTCGCVGRLYNDIADTWNF